MEKERKEDDKQKHSGGRALKELDALTKERNRGEKEEEV